MTNQGEEFYKIYDDTNRKYLDNFISTLPYIVGGGYLINKP